MMAQLLATEGFVTVEDIAYIETGDLANLEGFSEELAQELQSRAVAWLEEQAEKMDAERRALGVQDDIYMAPGVTPQMAILLGKGDVKTLEDFAGLVADDLRGWFETKNGERIRHPGILDSLTLSQEEADALILGARVAAGWIEAPPEEEAVEEEVEEGSETVESVFR
jgi:N utilization substance protein A